MKKTISLFLALVLLLGMLPAGMPKTSAMYTWLKDRELVDGQDFTRSANMAEKLDSIFDGNVNIYQDLKCTKLVDARFGSNAVPNNGVYQYIGPEGGPAICSGTSCWVYANGVYYTLFGESTFSGVAGANSEKLNLAKTTTRSISYENFLAWGVRPAVGALIRGQNHSVIVLGYDSETLTILDGNGDGKGLISIRIRSWDEVNYTVDYIIQPKADFYNATYPGWEVPTFANTYPAACILEVSSGDAFVANQPGSDSICLEPTAKGVRYAAERLVEMEDGTLWYEVRTREGEIGYLHAGAVTWLADQQDVTATGITAPAIHAEGQAFSLTGSILTRGTALTAVTAGVYQETEEGKTLLSGGEASAAGSYYNLSKSPMDVNKTFNQLTEGTYTYEVTASYARCHVADGEVVTDSGTATLYSATFLVIAGAVVCNHVYEQTAQEATCFENGSQTSICKNCATGYTEQLPATGIHTYEASVAKEATCTEYGIRALCCSLCPVGTSEVIPAPGHTYGDWQTVTEAACLKEGLQKRICSACSAEETQLLTALEHNYVSQWVEANCSDYAKELFTCENCGDSYSVYPDPMTQWTETKPEGIEESRLETKTQYRYSDYEQFQSYEANLPGATLLESSWQEAETKTVQYVKSWPAGFSTEHSLYAAYNNTPYTEGETAEQRVTVQEDTLTGYLYYHWCQGTYAYGPINRGAKATSYGVYTAFHAFYSTTNPATLVAASDASYTYCNSACCRDSYWYFAVPVYTQTASVSQNLFTYERWTEWSDWSDTEYTAAESRKVEERVLYRYSTQVLGDHTFAESKVTAEPTCQTEGIRTFYCSHCDATQTQSMERVEHCYETGSCIWCGANDPNAVVFLSHPEDETVKLGNRAAFTVEAEGPIKAFRWQYQMVEGGPWWNCTQYTKGYNTAELNVIAAEKRQGFRYRCRITDANGKKYYSETAELTVDIPESYAVLSQPQNTWVMPGSTTTFHIETQGEGLTYQWEYHKGVDQSGPQYYWIAMGSTAGCKTDTLTIAGVSGSTNRDGWAYRCVVTDANGYIYTTDYAFLHVAAAQITAQPESVTAAAGSKAEFSVNTEGEVISYQWQYSKDGGKSWYNSSSATQGYNTNTLTVAATAARNGFLYRCKITDSEGNLLITNPAQLTVE